jgi:DUF917 family protein
VVEAICSKTGGEIIGEGVVSAKSVVYTQEAFDIGTITVGSGANARVLHVMNEFMAVVGADGARLATYPDVIATLDDDGAPVSSGHIDVGMRLRILRVSKDKLPLSSSITDPSVYPVVEKALGINISNYALGR